MKYAIKIQIISERRFAAKHIFLWRNFYCTAFIFITSRFRSEGPARDKLKSFFKIWRHLAITNYLSNQFHR